MINKIEESIKLFISNFRLFSKIILTVWLPGSILIVLLRHYVFPAMSAGDELRSLSMELRISNLIELAFSPLYGGALLYALSRIKQGLNVSYKESMTYASQRSYKLFSTRFSTGFIVILGLIAFIIPGIILGLRFALIDEVVVLEKISGSEARKLSAKLTQGKKLKIFLTTIVTGISAVIFSTIISWILYLPLTIIGQESNFLWDVIDECFLALIFSIFYVLLFLFYWEGKKNLAESD